MDSVLRLDAISHSPPPRFVHNIQLDAEPIFAEVAWPEWRLNVNSFGKWATPDAELWWARYEYQLALRQERDTIGSGTELRARWLSY
jgi:hypothetical protein